MRVDALGRIPPQAGLQSGRHLRVQVGDVGGFEGVVWGERDETGVKTGISTFLCGGCGGAGLCDRGSTSSISSSGNNSSNER